MLFVRHAAGHLLDDEERAILRRLVEERGVAGAARALGVSRGVVASAAGGIKVMRGSIELVRAALARRREEAVSK